MSYIPVLLVVYSVEGWVVMLVCLLVDLLAALTVVKMADLTDVVKVDKKVDL